MKRLIQPRHANDRCAAGLGCVAVFCLAALLAALTVGCGGPSGSTKAYVNNAAHTGNGFKVLDVPNQGPLTDPQLGAQGSGPTREIQITADNSFAYYLDASGGPCAGIAAPPCSLQIHGFRHTGNGTLTTQLFSPLNINEGTGSALAISPDKTNPLVFVAVPDAQGGELAVYSVDQNGQLSECCGGNQLASNFPITQLAVSPTGNVLYGLSPSKHAVVSFTYSSNGLLSIADTFSLPSTTISDHGMILTANGRFIYVVDNQLTGQYTDHSGLSGLSPNIYGIETYLALPSGTAAGTLKSLGIFHENADLTLTAENPNPCGNFIHCPVFPKAPVGGASSADSHFLYIINQGTQDISVFTIPDNGDLTGREIPGSLSNGVTTQSPFPCGCTPDFVAVPKSNSNFLYVLDTSASAIFQFTNQGTGQLKPLNPVSVSVGAGTSPTSITIQ